MNQDLTTRAGVAEILEASGIDFRTGLSWFEDKPMNNQGMLYSYTGVRTMPSKRSARQKGESGDKQFARSMEGYKGPWLTANQSEAILEKLGVQVVWVGEDGMWFVIDSYVSWDYTGLDCGWTCKLEGIPRQDRELVNAAAVAWFCINELEKIKEVMG